MTPIVRTATLEEIHRLYQRIPEFGGLHSLAVLQQRIGAAPASLLIAEIDGQPAGFKLGYQRQETVFTAGWAACCRHSVATAWRRPCWPNKSAGRGRKAIAN